MTETDGAGGHFRDRVRERDLDNFLVEELQASEAFRTWLLGRLPSTFRPPDVGDVRLQKSPPRLDGRQTDVRLGWFADGELKACVLIESKITAEFQPGQVQDYVREGDRQRKELGEARCCTLLVGPAARLASLDHAGFGATISVEDIAASLAARLPDAELDPELRARLSVRLDLLDALAGKRAGGAWTPVTIAGKRDFALAYAALAQEMAPDLTVRPSTDGPKALTRFFDGVRVPLDFPARVLLKHEFGLAGQTKYANLQLSGASNFAAPIQASGLLRGTPFGLARSEKSLFIRGTTPGLDPTADFEAQRGSVAEGIAMVKQLADWLVQAAPRLAELLHPGEEGQPANPGRDASAENEFDRAMRRICEDSIRIGYLAMMTVRLIEMHRVLRPDGSLYLHCDPTASHYLKVILDGIFGGNFRNEIVWKRTTTHSDSGTWSRVSDAILFYTASKTFTWNTPRDPLSQRYKDDKYSHDDGDGRRYQLDNMTSPNPRPNMMYEWKGFPYPAKGWRYSKDTMARLDGEGLIWYPTNDDGSLDTSRRLRFKRYLETSEGGVMGNIWTDIAPVNSQAKERIGYPTQKPVALLERILKASSNKGQVVLDPFCGCGTTVEAAQRLERQWIGIDVTHHAIDVIEGRLNDRCPAASYKVQGRPEDLEAAHDLARRDKYEFQWWANWLIGAQNYRERKKGSDGGIDGVIYFRNGPWGVGNIIISVKGGDNIGVQMVRDLRGTVEREEAEMGVLISLARPTSPMIAEAAAAGFVRQSAHGRLPRLQIVTIEELLVGRRPAMPPPIETEAFRQKLRPTRPTRPETPDAQLQLPLSLAGGKKRSDVEEHLSGAVIARLSGGS